jgi:hypothetical protein
VVPVQDNGGILIKILLLDPADELVHLSAGTGEGVGIPVSFEILTAQFTLISVLKVGINCQYGKVEGLIFGSQFCHLFFGVKSNLRFLLVVFSRLQCVLWLNANAKSNNFKLKHRSV